MGIVGKATPLKDDLGNELKVGDVVFFIKTMIISYEDVEENAKISKAVHKILKNKKKGK